MAELRILGSAIVSEDEPQLKVGGSWGWGGGLAWRGGRQSVDTLASLRRWRTHCLQIVNQSDPNDADLR